MLFGDRGVLGGVGGCDGGLGSYFGGPSDRFSRILPGKDTIKDLTVANCVRGAICQIFGKIQEGSGVDFDI